MRDELIAIMSAIIFSQEIVCVFNTRNHTDEKEISNIRSWSIQQALLIHHEITGERR
jgi:hypothetical protein